jgi:hypothetical protein
LLHQSTLVMTETLATFLAVVTLVCLTLLDRRSTPWLAGLAGGSLALAGLCRPTFFVWLAAAAVATMFADGAGRRRATRLALMLLVAAIVVTPWTARNYFLFGRPIYATTHGGYTLLWGNNPRYYQHLREAAWGAVWDAKEWEPLTGALTQPMVPSAGPPSKSSIAGEIIADQLAYAQARDAIKAEPGMFVYASLVRVGHLWRPLPYRTSATETTAQRLVRYAVLLWYMALYVLAALGICTLGWKLFERPWLWGVLLCIAVTAVHSCYWTDMRMRAPLTPLVCLLAAAGSQRAVLAVVRRK